MGLFTSGGGYGQHNPEYRRQMEDLLMRQTFGQMLMDSPELSDYFVNSPEGKKALEKMGVTSVDQLTQYAPKGAPSLESYQGILEDIQGIDPTVQQEYTPVELTRGQQYDPYQFSTQDISDIPDQAYEGAQLMQEEAQQRGFGRALEQLKSQMGARGFGPGGMTAAEGTSLGRDYLQQLSDIGRQTAYQKARDVQDVAKFQSQMDLQRQRAQAGEKQYGSNLAEQMRQFNQQFKSGERRYQTEFGSGLDRWAKDFGLRKAGAEADALGLIGQRSGMPMQQGGQYLYNTGQWTGPPKKSSVFGKIVGGLGSLAGAAGGILGPVSGLVKGGTGMLSGGATGAGAGMRY